MPARLRRGRHALTFRPRKARSIQARARTNGTPAVCTEPYARRLSAADRNTNAEAPRQYPSARARRGHVEETLRGCSLDPIRSGTVPYLELMRSISWCCAATRPSTARGDRRQYECSVPAQSVARELRSMISSRSGRRRSSSRHMQIATPVCRARRRSGSASGFRAPMRKFDRKSRRRRMSARNSARCVDRSIHDRRGASRALEKTRVDGDDLRNFWTCRQDGERIDRERR